jgi:hypothetical protein
MKNRRQHDILKPDVFDMLSATWVLSCNDENPIITYEGLRHRLNADSSFDVKALVASRGDLFRRGAPRRRLEAWKEQMRADRHLPSWIREVTEDALRQKLIEGLSSDDVFRCQFRAEDAAPKAPLEVLNFGLEHIDRLRKVHYEAREKSAKSWQMWLVVGVGLLNIAATIITAILKKSP